MDRDNEAKLTWPRLNAGILPIPLTACPQVMLMYWGLFRLHPYSLALRHMVQRMDVSHPLRTQMSTFLFEAQSYTVSSIAAFVK